MTPKAIFTFNPPKTETKVVEVAPASVTLTVTPKQAAQLLALLGEVSHSEATGLYDGLEALVSANGIERLTVYSRGFDELPPLHFKPRGG